MRFMQTESVLQTKNRSEPAKNRFSVALPYTIHCFDVSKHQKLSLVFSPFPELVSVLLKRFQTTETF